MNKTIMTHVIAGYPSMKKCKDLIMLMSESGVGFIEIQIPFSDPVADGPVIMQACEKSLKSGVKVSDCFDLMKKMSKKVTTPLLFMSYFNILHHYGVEKFCKKAKECGCYGLIVPDIPFDEEKYDHYVGMCKKYGLNPIRVISPLTPENRLVKIGKIAKGFIYCVSRFGTTGDKRELNPKLKSYLMRVRKYTDLPLAVGFGISKKSHTYAVHKVAEIAVIGSKILKMAEKDDFQSIGILLNSK